MHTKNVGDSIIGFGSYEYKKDGSQHSFMLIRVSPRKSAFTIYIMPGFEKYGGLLAKLENTNTQDHASI